MIVVSLGPDPAIAREAAIAAARRADPGGDNTTWHDADASVSQLAASAGSVGFFGPRVMIVTDLLARAAKGAGEGDAPSSARSKPALDLAPLLGGVPAQNLLVLLDPALASVPAAIRKLLPNDAEVLSAEPLRGRALLAWMSSVAAESGGSLDEPVARLVAESLYPQHWQAKPANPRYDRPPDMARLHHEVEKLALAASPGPVEARHVLALTAGHEQENLFGFIDAAIAGDLGRATKELDRLVASGEDPGMLVAQLLQQAELAAVGGEAGRHDPVAVGRDLGLPNPQRMGGVMRSIRGAGTHPRDLLAAATETDRMLKQGRLRQPEDGLAHLLSLLAAKRRTGGR